MKKALILALALVLMASVAFAAIATTKHNLSSNSTNAAAKATSETQICVFCHTPHGASTDTTVPLWNKTMTSQSFSMYSSATIDMTIAGQPQGVSLACLTCHDGSTSVGAVINLGGSATTIAMGGADLSSGKINVSPYNFGTDLSNDHPISLTYDITKDTAFNTKASAQAAGIEFFGAGVDQVECGSCHEVHGGTGFNPLLRDDPAGSKLCLDCHIK